MKEKSIDSDYDNVLLPPTVYKITMEKKLQNFSCEFHSRFHLCFASRKKNIKIFMKKFVELNGGFSRDWFGI
jgi:hypothetical protein